MSNLLSIGVRNQITNQFEQPAAWESVKRISMRQ
jgi:hypothetical protein